MWLKQAKGTVNLPHVLCMHLTYPYMSLHIHTMFNYVDIVSHNEQLCNYNDILLFNLMILCMNDISMLMIVMDIIPNYN